ncbi:MAG: hypothetical protein CSA81_08810 [Acidobacteria bacterium]|nr:MAG: hypothetical protein CSA81_08810 [Acidobacteriota bacterium]
MRLFENTEIQGNHLRKIFQEAVYERAPAFIRTNTFFYEGDLIAMIDQVLYMSNSISREDILTFLKGNRLEFKVAQGGALYNGETRCLGLGHYRNKNILKLAVPKKMKNNDPRMSYRLRSFEQLNSISFSYGELKIATGQLVDISMSGLGFKPDPLYKMDELQLRPGMEITVNAKVEKGWSVSTFAKIRHITRNKIGVEYLHLNKNQKDALFKFIARMRKAEVQKKLALQEMRTKASQSIKTKVSSSAFQKPTKPIALIFFEESEDLAVFLSTALGRRFDVFKEPFKTATMRDHLNEIEPDLILLELCKRDSSSTSRRKKVASAIAGHIPYMLYGENFDPEFVMINFTTEDQRRLLLDLTGRRTIQSYKKIESFFGKKGS